MRGLFAVYVVEPESGEVIHQDVVVADQAKKAEFRVLSHAMRLNENQYDIDDLDVVVVRLDDIRPKKEVVEVRTVE